jgi:Zn-dependent M16 (insulinase) family peptidase
MDTLHKLDEEGFSEDDIASSVNTIEFQLREGGGGLEGMEIFLGALSKWNYDADPMEALVYEDALSLLKAEIDKTASSLFQQIIRDSLIGNNHRVVLELYPSSSLEEEQLQVRPSVASCVLEWSCSLNQCTSSFARRMQRYRLRALSP